ncbi:MAG: biopolymer transporter ExbD, partial [Rubricoccaceae bacterium]|nr:biopolymer transporter ExbD [Rubricoccaceae bacterium]
RNLLNVLVNQTGDVLVDGQYLSLDRIRDEVKRHITNRGQLPNYSDSPDLAIVSFKTERGLAYGQYINVLDEIKSAYLEVRDEYAQQTFNMDYVTYQATLSEDDVDLVVEEYPMKISLAEPDPGGGAAPAAPADG